MHRFLALAFSLLTLAACGDDAQCVIDTDCELGFYCSDNSCFMIGTGPDAEAPADTGGGDADVDDAAIDDAPANDVGSDDAGADDAGDDAATCDYVGMYTLTADPANPAECAPLALTGCRVTEAEPPLVDCGTLVATCELVGCTCTGNATVGDEEVPFIFDFSAGTLQAQLTCNYTLASL